MEPKTIVAIVLVAFIIGGFIFLQIRSKTRSELIIQGAEPKLRPFSTTRRRDSMNQQKTVESRVLSILKDCPRARFDDMILIMHYYNRYADFLRAGELPLNDLAFNYKVYGLPCFETIRRARQRVQSLFPEYSRNAEQDDMVIIIGIL